MEAKEAFGIVLDMARELRETCKVEREDIEMEALAVAEAYMVYWRGKAEDETITYGDKKLKEMLKGSK